MKSILLPKFVFFRSRLRLSLKNTNLLFYCFICFLWGVALRIIIYPLPLHRGGSALPWLWYYVLALRSFGRQASLKDDSAVGSLSFSSLKLFRECEKYGQQKKRPDLASERFCFYQYKVERISKTLFYKRFWKRAREKPFFQKVFLAYFLPLPVTNIEPVPAFFFA